MIDYVLITVRYANKMEKDMELPAQVEINKLNEMLLDSLQTAEPMLFSLKEKIDIRFNGKVLNSGTLFENKVWDGSIVELI